MLDYFLHDRRPLAYNRIAYNNCSERSIELPLAIRFLLDSGAGGRQPYLEIGNVMAHYEALTSPYSTLSNRRVLDKFERAPGVINADLMEFDERYAVIVSLSTVEHIGQHAYGEERKGDREAPLKALRRIYNLLQPGGQALVTVPYGKLMDLGWLIQFSGVYLDGLSDVYGVPREAIQVDLFRKLDMEMRFDAPKQTWVQTIRSDMEDVEFDSPFPFANGIAAIRLTKIGADVAEADAPVRPLRYVSPVAIGSLYVPPFVRPFGYDLDGWMDAGAPGYLFYGPYVKLAAGRYRLQTALEWTGSGMFTLDAATRSGRQRLWSADLHAPGLSEATIRLPEGADDFEIRLYKHNASACRVRVPRLRLVRIGEADSKLPDELEVSMC